MVWRYVKAQAWVLLCGGLVGPIFLAVYFATGQSELMKWMFWVGLLITAVDVLAALGLTAYGANAQARSEALEADGVLALATITGLAETNTRINDRPLVRLQLNIAGPGITPFAAEDQVIAGVDRLPMLTARRLVVLVDPATHKFQIDWNRSGLINGLMPATFSVAEDNRTYDLSGQVEPLMEILQILKANGIGMNSMVDLRDNPVARAQVQAVVRRAAARRATAPEPQASTTAAPPRGTPAVSTAQRLQELETLRATGAITDQEYAAKRRQIIAEL
ncbi:MAG: SHOCT domain-containing protein [Mycolicibacterium neoaurum]|uniref:SHOCT domain-containing protein n=1 Tax=Mycolicibacterium neoaurum TaxID=1795 RepID=UPI002FFC26CD